MVGSSTDNTADTVALSLLAQFPDAQLPAASELHWLVSEQDAPQQLLPLPNSKPVSPDDGDRETVSTDSASGGGGNDSMVRSGLISQYQTTVNIL